MKLITKQELMRGVAQRFKEQYFNPCGGWEQSLSCPPREKTWRKLASLPPDATEGQVEKIIGNRSWTSIVCDNCDSDVDAVVVLGEPPSYHSRTARICLSCLSEALKLLAG